MIDPVLSLRPRRSAVCERVALFMRVARARTPPPRAMILLTACRGLHSFVVQVAPAPGAEAHTRSVVPTAGGRALVEYDSV
eukprot:COSAG01_NODE_16708_length_1212_cov_3.263252_2_plen_81_part_00